jgi:hypothetical protein
MQENLKSLVEVFSEPEQPVWDKVKQELTEQERLKMRSILADRIMVLKTAMMYLED